jgi:rhodanese-related sulfurtransferase
MDLRLLLEEIKNNQAWLIDVRELDEWNQEHCTNAHSLPLSGLLEGKIPSDLPKEIPIYLHCRKGKRAQRAAEILKIHYPLATPLKEGFEDLKDASFPTETSDFREL